MLKATDQLLQFHVIERVPEAEMFSGHYLILFLIPKRSEEDRVVLVLKHLNKFIRKTRLKMETLNSIAVAICQGNYFISIDLKTYLHVPIHWKHKRFL